ncbi:type I-C CRISPR-associated protein Cas7/Csd2 [Shuttleworthella satelles]|nr:type I-C CRISPR-associated protein Cas7/Csd2 [Shuttleworthia satelles]
MGTLQNKIDFVVIAEVKNANPNGDPLNENRPRVDYDGYGEISDVCIKRKIRNRMQDMGNMLFVQSEDRRDDDCKSLHDRAKKVLGEVKALGREKYAEEACKQWIDVRSFGQVFAFKNEKKESGGESLGIRGPVSIHQAVSVSPVEVESMQITKSVNGETAEKRTSDTMGMKHYVKYGVYLIKGAINVQLAEKTGFSEEDAEKVKECLRTLFVNDASSARPDGSMEIIKVYWWKHNCKEGQYSSAKVHRSVKIEIKEGVTTPSSIEDYDIEVMPLAGLEPEIINGV